ncbi:MAG: hypothetical protein RJB68_1021 [Pseudomonadota bacterium]|jgi:hypothetical protein
MNVKTVIKSVVIAASLAVASVATQAQDFVFDYGSFTASSNRGAGDSPASFFSSVESDTVIGSISVLNDLNSDGEIRFAIFDHPTETLLFSTGPIFFADNGMSWKTSNTFSFTLLAGHQYDIGAVANVGGRWAYTTGANVTQNGLTMTSRNANFSGFDAITSGNHAAALIPIQITTAVPEPETYAMLLAGLGLMGAISRRRKTKLAE